MICGTLFDGAVLSSVKSDPRQALGLPAGSADNECIGEDNIDWIADQDEWIPVNLKAEKLFSGLKSHRNAGKGL